MSRTAAWPASIALPIESVAAWHRLTGALASMADEGAQPPCASDPAPFTSERPSERAEAAARCLTCPAREPCAAFGQHGAEHYVWGGIDLAPGARPRSAS